MIVATTVGCGMALATLAVYQGCKRVPPGSSVRWLIFLAAAVISVEFVWLPLVGEVATADHYAALGLVTLELKILMEWAVPCCLQRWWTMNRYDEGTHFVPATVDSTATPRVIRVDVPDLPMPTNGSEDAAALRSLGTTTEQSTPAGRAVATNIRAVGLLTAVGVVALALKIAGAPVAMAAMGFACLALAGYIWIVKLDHDHSPAGIERRKVDSYAAIRDREIGAQERIALAKLDAYMKILDKAYGNNRD